MKTKKNKAKTQNITCGVCETSKESNLDISYCSISFSFDNFEILGVFGKKIYLRGDIFQEGSEGDECIIIISHKLLNKAMSLWIKDKKEYCERWDEFCGKMGSIYLDKYTEVDRINLLSINNEKFFMARAFEVISFENSTDMEHG